MKKQLITLYSFIKIYLFQILLILLGILMFSCEKDLLDDITIENINLNPDKIHKTSLQNDEWNNGWWDNLTMSTKYGGTSPAYFLRGFTYFDYEGDGDMDVFSHLNHHGNSWMTTPVEYGIHIKTENGWHYKKLKNQFNKFASRLTSADIDNDGDVDFIIFVADDPNLYGMGVGANVPGYPNNTGPAGGIYAYVQEEGEFVIREIVPYQDSAKEYIAGNQFYYHGGTLGDINNDGFIDIVSGTQRTKAWLNNGDGTFGSEIIIGRDGDFNQLFNCSHHLFDINQDGYMDLITGEAKSIKSDVRYFQTFTKEDYAIHTIIYYGKGSYPFYESEPDVLLEPQFSFVSDDLDKMFYETYDCMIDLSIVDFDDDGDYDIFTNTYKPILNHSDMSEVKKGHLISYYENVNNTFVEKTSSVFEEDEWFTTGCNSGITKVYDIDNDGKKEILSEGGDCALNGEYYNAWKMTNGKFRKILIQN